MMNENETNAAPIVPPTSASGCSALRPTDSEIDLEAKQWAEECGAYIASIDPRTAWKLGALWARSIYTLSKPNTKGEAPK